jgi:hypothetical protein
VKYVPSAFIGQLSRSQGSTTASHNRFGSYFRNRTIPTNPNTAGQAAQRAVIASFSAGWRGLTESQRNGWKILGSSMSRLDSQGQPYTLTGLQAYESVNRNQTTAGNATVSDAPTFTPPTTLTSLTITATA